MRRAISLLDPVSRLGRSRGRCGVRPLNTYWGDSQAFNKGTGELTTVTAHDFLKKKSRMDS